MFNCNQDPPIPTLKLSLAWLPPYPVPPPNCPPSEPLQTTPSATLPAPIQEEILLHAWGLQSFAQVAPEYRTGVVAFALLDHDLWWLWLELEPNLEDNFIQCLFISSLCQQQHWRQRGSTAEMGMMLIIFPILCRNQSIGLDLPSPSPSLSLFGSFSVQTLSNISCAWKQWKYYCLISILGDSFQ